MSTSQQMKRIYSPVTSATDIFGQTERRACYDSTCWLEDQEFQCQCAAIDRLFPRALVRRPVDPRYPVRVRCLEQLVHEALNRAMSIKDSLKMCDGTRTLVSMGSSGARRSDAVMTSSGTTCQHRARHTKLTHTLEGNTKLLRLLFARLHRIGIRMLRRRAQDERHRLTLDELELALHALAKMPLVHEVEQAKLDLGLGHVLDRGLGHVAQVELHVRFGCAEERLDVRLGGHTRVAGVRDGVVGDDLRLVWRAGVVEGGRAFEAQRHFATHALQGRRKSFGARVCAFRSETHLYAPDEP